MSEIQQIAKELLTLQAKGRAKKVDEAGARKRAQLIGRLRGLVRDIAGSSPDERRRFLRVSAPLEVVFRVGEATITAAASEMSLGGLSLRGHLWLITEQQMRIESLRVGDEVYPLRVRCRVAWRVSAKDGMPRAGLQFVDIDDQAQTQIRAIFEALFRRFLERLAAGDPLAIEPDAHGSKGGRKTKAGGAAKQADAKKETGKKETAKKETGKKETAKEETVKKETAKKETAKKETAKKAAKKETAEYGTETRKEADAKASAMKLGPRQRISDRKW